ncbi:MAG: hypothetical protein K6U12_08775 [Armatimonadetes bacterium]|nr:hypothetical protein [Armatimonadota bacterium]
MSPSRWLHGLLGIVILVLVQFYAVAEWIQNEPPRGTLVGRVFSSRTLQPIPKAEVMLVLQKRLPEESSEGARRRALLLEQGWIEEERDEVGSIWSVRTDAHGRFALRGIPAGVYRLTAYSQAHSLRQPPHYEEIEVAIPEGARVEQDLYLQPDEDFMELIHPQAVYYPDEPLKIGVRGFTQEDEMEVALLTLKGDRAPSRRLMRLLEDLRYGWWRSSRELQDEFEKLADTLELVWTQRTPITGRDPEGVFTRYVELPRQPEGVYIARIRVGALERAAVVVVSRFGIVFKQDGERMEFWCADLKTGQPVPNVRLQLWESPARELQKLGEGRTDAQGFWRVQGGRGERIYIFALSPDGARLIHWASGYAYGRSDNPLYGAIYTDRPIYRPGHTIHYKGIVRLQTPQGYIVPPPNTPVEIEVVDPRDETYTTQQVKLNDYGAFSGEFTLSPESSTGYYILFAKVGDYGTVDQGIPVSAYRRPSYRIQARPSKTLHFEDETIEVEVYTEYYFGMPVPNTKIEYQVYREPRVSDDYGCIVCNGPPWQEVGGVYGEEVLTGEATTDGQGRLRLRFRARDLLPEGDTGMLGTEPYPFTLSLSGLSEGWEAAKASVRFSIAPCAWEIRIKPEYWFGEPNQPYRIEVEVQDLRTKQPVQTTLQVKAGRFTWAGRYRVTEYPFRQTLQTDSRGKAVLEWTPPESGEWQLVVSAQDPTGRRCEESTTLWIFGRRYWAQEVPDSRNPLEVRLQKEQYMPGESVEVAIRSPYPDAVYYVSLEGARLFQSQVVKATGSLTRVKIPLTTAQIPTAYVSVCMVRNKQLYQRTLDVAVGTRNADLNIRVQTDRARYAPRDTVQVRIQTTDAQGRPVPAELSLAVVDEGIYSIMEDDPHRLRHAFYAHRFNRVSTSFSAPYLALQGDKGEVEDTRRDFPDTAFWLPHLRTNPQGVAQTTFRLPDNLTEWRLTVWGHTLKTQIGYAKAAIKSAKDLMVRLRTPLWLVEGDKTELSAIVSNNTHQPRTVQVVWHTPEGTQSQQLTVAPNDSRTLSYPYRARKVGVQTIRVSAREVNGRLRDAEERQFEVKPAATPQVATRVLLLKAERQIVMNLLPDSRHELGTLEIEVQPTLFQFLTARLDYLIEYPYGCVEQTVSRFVPAVLARAVYRQRGEPMPPELEKRVEEALKAGLQRLAELESPEGGWGWWEAEEPEPWITAYAMRGLYRAKQAGVPVPEPLYERGLSVLQRMADSEVRKYREALQELPSPSIDPLLEVLEALAEMGEPAPDALREEPALLNRMTQQCLNMQGPWVHEPRMQMMMLLVHWSDLPNARKHLRTLWNALQNDYRETADALYWFREERDDLFVKKVASQARALRLLLKLEPFLSELNLTPRRYRQMVEKTVLGLVLTQYGEAWYSSYDSALAIEALLAYIQRYEGADARGKPRVQVWVNDKPVPAFEGKVRLQSEWLRRGENLIRLRAESGVPIVVARLTSWHPLTYAERQSGVIRMRLYALQPSQDVLTPSETLRPIPLGGVVRTGTLLRVEVELTRPRNVSDWDYSVLEAPFPAGCAPVDTEAFLKAGWWASDYSEIRDDRALSFQSSWGWYHDTHRFAFLVRAEVPGEYSILPARLWGMYAPFSVSSEAFRIVVRE